MAADGYSKPAPSDAEILHGIGQTGKVLHASYRHPDTTCTSEKGPDAGMSASLGRTRAASDYKGSTPEDVNTAPGQRTTKSLGYGATPPRAPSR